MNHHCCILLFSVVHGGHDYMNEAKQNRTLKRMNKGALAVPLKKKYLHLDHALCCVQPCSRSHFQQLVTSCGCMTAEPPPACKCAKMVLLCARSWVLPRQILIGPLVKNCTYARLCFMFDGSEMASYSFCTSSMCRVPPCMMNHSTKLPHLPSGV